MGVRAISPLDGRYEAQVAEIAACFSEWALIKFRVHVEVEWLIALSSTDCIPEVRTFTPDEREFLRGLAANFDDAAAERVKAIEATTRHDVKAVEYYLKERLRGTSLETESEFVHFACTSEDISNLAYGLMLKNGMQEVWLPAAEALVNAVNGMAVEHRAEPMLAHTHGQPASPTTVGKELAVFVLRWRRQLSAVRRLEYLGKINGAVGNFNAHTAAYPDAPWQTIARSFVESLGLTYNPLTTQIEPHDYLAECFHAVQRFNTITIDFDRDIWSYISFGYLKQRVAAGEVGSSTMPHKVNPINFENSEANMEMSSALLNHLAGKLPLSRLQRDLTDTSTLRNIGVALGHSCVALKSALRGLGELSVNREAIGADLNSSWEVLGEAIQTVMRKDGHANPYEVLK
ncbi:MAG: adenylosuccinate lyase, partial [Chloroflexi bacterium]|nr:adenylosuccinate lyase [Chloroflexota bacterium]